MTHGKGNGTPGKFRRRAAVGVAVALLLAGARMPAGAAGDEVTAVDPVQVTATRIPKKASEQASSVSVVTREEIEGKQAEVVGDALRTVPGIEVQRAGTVGARENIRIRGAKSQHTQVLIDGFPVNSPTSGEFDIGSLPADAFERIEVVRGSQSALYGSNALAGVVNFIPRSGDGGAETGLALAGGSHNALKGNAHIQGGGPKRSLFLGVGGFRSEGTMPNDGTDQRSFLGVGNLSLAGKDRLHAIALSTDSHKGNPVDSSPVVDIRNESIRRDLLLGARWELALTAALAVSATGSIMTESLHLDDPGDPGDPAVLDSLTRSRKSTAGLMARYSPGPVSTTFVGVEYLKDRAINRLDWAVESPWGAFSGGGTTDDGILNRSVYLQEELHPTPASGISLGARLDRNSAAGTQFNPKAGAYYDFEAAGVRIRAAGGRGFRNPTILEKTDPFTGNPSLTKEKARSYEGGADFRLPAGKGSLSATYFYEDLRGAIQQGAGSLVNLDAMSRGVESGLTCRLARWMRVDAMYTYTKARDKKGEKRMPGVPTHRGSASLLLSPVPEWESRIDWLAESDQLDYPMYSSKDRRPGFSRVDLSSRYRFERAASGIEGVALTGRVRNALNRRYEERLDLPAPGIEFLLGAELRI